MRIVSVRGKYDFQILANFMKAARVLAQPRKEKARLNLRNQVAMKHF
jgi:hypothetical protein